MNKPADVTFEGFDAEVIDSSTPVLLDFWAPWCPPCRAVAPLLEDLAAEYGDSLKVRKINIDEQPDLADAFGIQSIPTLIVVKNGGPVQAFIGAPNHLELRHFVEDSLHRL